MDYIVICQAVTGNPDRGFQIEYMWDGERFDDLIKANAHGWEIRDSDDFNIATLEGEKMTQWLTAEGASMGDPEGHKECADYNEFQL